MRGLKLMLVNGAVGGGGGGGGIYNNSAVSHLVDYNNLKIFVFSAKQVQHCKI